MPETTNTPEHTTASPDQKTYQINPPFIVPVLGGSYAFIAIVVLLDILIKQGFSLFRVLIACLILLGIAIFTFVMARLYGIARLTSSPDGLIYYSLYYTLYTPWDNISRIVNLPRTGGTSDALQLRDAATRMPIVQGIREHCPAIKFSSLPQLSFASIPHAGPISSPYDSYHIIRLGWHWRKREFAQELQKYAPHVFTARPNYQQPGKRSV